MHNTIFFNTASFTTGNLISPFTAKVLILGLITFVFSYLLIRTLDKEGHFKRINKAIRKKWDIIRHGNAIMLVKDGVLQLDKLYASNITTQQVYSALRRKKIYHLGDVERLFLIPGGEFSIYRKKESGDSLPVLQYSDKEIMEA